SVAILQTLLYQNDINNFYEVERNRSRCVNKASRACCGLARPFEVAIIFPTSQPSTADLPDRYCVTCVGFAAITRSTHTCNVAASESCITPNRSLATSGASPVWKTSARTALAAVLLNAPA